jgi:hypothetical protein
MNGLTSKVLMIRPYSFHKNEETAKNNYYQKDLSDQGKEATTQAAQAEFDAFAAILKEEGIEVIVHQDTEEYETPDSLFPNNWISFHPQHKAILYPMFAINRRLERNPKVLATLQKAYGSIAIIADYSEGEKEGLFLEGTGSMVLDREHKIAYAALSKRTDSSLLHRFCKEHGFEPMAFHSYQTVGSQRLPIYHTNVMMSVGPTFAVIGLDTLDRPEEKVAVLAKLETTGKEVLVLSEAQINQFAGNMLTLRGQDGPLLVMSSAAYHSLTTEQIQYLETHAKLIHSPLTTIEHCGGGSARCMLAELF